MSMSMQNHLYAMPGKQGPQCSSVGESFTPPDHLCYGRMMDEEHSKQALSAGTVKDIAEPVHLRSPKVAGGKKWSRLVRGGHPNQRDMTAHADAWKELMVRRSLCVGLYAVVGDHVGRPQGEGVVPYSTDVGIMVARDNGDVGRRAKGLQPLAGLLKLTGQAKLGQIARNHDMVRRHIPQIATQGGQHLRDVLTTTPEPPGEITERPFIQEVADLRVDR